MIKGLEILEYFPNKNPKIMEVSYSLKTKKATIGPLRSMQKFKVILLTSTGTDPLRPWFGTKLNKLIRMNITNTTELRYFIRQECKSAINQFFNLQAGEAKQNNQKAIDVIDSIELVTVDIIDKKINLVFRIKPLRGDATLFTVDLTKSN